MNAPDDPKRLIDDPAIGRLGEWLRAGQNDLPSDADLERLAQRLGPTFSAPVALRVSPWSPKLKLGLGLGLAGVAVVGALWLLRSPKIPAPSVANAPVPAVTQPSVAPAAAPATPPVLAAPDAAPETTANAPAPSASRASNVNHFPSEAQLLERARRALTSDPARALALTRQHAARFPHGVLQQEREVIAIEALRRLGQSGAASQRANSFEQSYPDSAHRRGVELSGRSPALAPSTETGHGP